MENLLKNIGDAAKEAAEKVGEKLGDLKDAAAEKVSEWSEAAEKLAAEAKEEAAEKMAELQAAKEKIAAHEGGALGFLSEKAKEVMDGIKDEASDLVETGKGFWEKAKDYIAGDDDKNNAAEEPAKDA